MATFPAQQADVGLTSNTSEHKESKRQLDMHYYLTEGLEDVKHHEYYDIRSFRGAIDSRADALHSNKVDESLACLNPYLVFSSVTPHQLENINHARKARYKNLRFLYLNEPRVLVVKYMPSPVHEMAARQFVLTIWEKIDAGGQKAEITTMGSTTYQGMQSEKEADGSLRPLRARPNHNDWPTVVLECGVSEKRRRLTADARWWIDNSEGAVKIILLFSVSTRDKTIQIELWKRDAIENLQHTSQDGEDAATGPTMKGIINITPDSVTGAPLKLEFMDIFLRRPKKKCGEADYIITEDNLRAYYNHIWPQESSQDEYSTEEEIESGSLLEGFAKN